MSLATFGGDSIEELDELVAEEDRRIAKAEAVAEVFDEGQRDAERRRAELVETLTSELDRVGAPAAAEINERVLAYLTAVQKSDERRDHEIKLERSRRELEQARTARRERARLLEERGRAEQRLRDAYEMVGIQDEQLEAAGAQFDRLYAGAQAAQQRDQVARQAEAGLGALLGDETLQDLERRADAAQEALATHVSQHGELAEYRPAGSPDDGITDIGEELENRLREVTELETRVGDLENDAADPARLKEHLDALERRIERLEEAKEAIGIAREELIESADELRREFAPHLNKALERSVARITSGRYVQAIVDRDLGVHVVVPETGQMKPADELSRATQDQLFFVQRVEIANLLAPTKGRAPLLLDDPFAHYDRNRLRHAVEILGEVAEERQIVLFSEDVALIGVARDVCPTCEVIELKPPSAP